MDWILLLGLTLNFYVASTTAFGLDNSIVGEPTVDCEESMVALTFKTKKPFTGRVYVQGLSDDEKCSRSFATNQNQSDFSLMVQNGDCTMQRQRISGKLEGVMYSVTIVVSFHGTFVTKADRAYRCMCFFRNIKRVTNSIDIAPLGTTELIDTAKTPTCTYSINAGSPDGPPVIFGQVGDRIFHVWRCDDPTQSFLVHSCYVTDGRGNRFDLLDLDGCAIDPLIQPDVIYDSNGQRAVVDTLGYKFSDTNVLNYECALELCKKAQGECDSMTPPKCGRAKRSTDAVVLTPNIPNANQTRRGISIPLRMVADPHAPRLATVIECDFAVMIMRVQIRPVAPSSVAPLKPGELKRRRVGETIEVMTTINMLDNMATPTAAAARETSQNAQPIAEPKLEEEEQVEEETKEMTKKTEEPIVQQPTTSIDDNSETLDRRRHNIHKAHVPQVCIAQPLFVGLLAALLCAACLVLVTFSIYRHRRMYSLKL